MLATKNPRQLSCCTRVARWCWTASHAEACPRLVSHQRADRVVPQFHTLSSQPTVASALVNRQIPVGSTQRGMRAVQTAPRWRYPRLAAQSDNWIRCHDAQVVNGSSDQTAPAPVVIRVSPMAHFAVGFFALGLLIPVLTWPPTAPLLVIPAVLSALIMRLRTLADQHGVTVRTLLGSQTVRWDEIDGLRFNKSSWARAQLRNGGELRLPAVTFATLPLLTEASAGRVPNPYR
jgi:Bacterial PH domain